MTFLLWWVLLLGVLALLPGDRNDGRAWGAVWFLLAVFLGTL